MICSSVPCPALLLCSDVLCPALPSLPLLVSPHVVRGVAQAAQWLTSDPAARQLARHVGLTYMADELLPYNLIFTTHPPRNPKVHGRRDLRADRAHELTAAGIGAALRI